MAAYYNEHDPKAAAWLRELIKEGHIAPGEVDERSILDVRPADLAGYTQCHFFAGIGGWSYALRLAGYPDDRAVWTGSCPCQPFSSAGKQLGDKDPRHLWPVFFDLIAQCRPELVFGEQVASAIGKGWLDGISADLESEGYCCGAAVLGAHSVGAPHLRQRLYWMAHAHLPSGDEWTRSGKQPIHHKDSRSGGLADAERDGGRANEQRRRAEGRAIDGRAGGLGNSESGGCREQRDAALQRSGRHAECASGAGSGGVADAEQPGLERLTWHGDDGNEPGRLRAEETGSTPESGSAGGSWSRFDILPCRDGKARRIESGTFPLAHGVSGRVGLLRGYGNAIVPQVAAEFIAASLEAISCGI